MRQALDICKIVAPVVVKPDAASKTASVTEAVDVSTNGSPPAKLATIQQMPTTANPSRKVRFRGVCERLVYASASPPPTMITSDESRPRKGPVPIPQRYPERQHQRRAHAHQQHSHDKQNRTYLHG